MEKIEQFSKNRYGMNYSHEFLQNINFLEETLSPTDLTKNKVKLFIHSLAASKKLLGFRKAIEGQKIEKYGNSDFFKISSKWGIDPEIKLFFRANFEFLKHEFYEEFKISDPKKKQTISYRKGGFYYMIQNTNKNLEKLYPGRTLCSKLRDHRIMNDGSGGAWWYSKINEKKYPYKYLMDAARQIMD